ncbi:MAG: chaperonin GroEL [Candidatus Lloydbacteria bacterium CG22_combo_CG10-13_8_21_14_all_47_15]|uniref:Chaperonin GroEL n=1 Tax=Candidatus Lloydbacteria bacterium CG22_combo_CG10-13_8_21_14_all_47_15 TaxID=1974635 RepID=A0A2H0CTN9_9BACT|nr:MAG: chaperonin GroEL [Candidatus Lloydbacteria bacterium CG22_combo_CG10-13_8_21_14_all_47_15]
MAKQISFNEQARLRLKAGIDKVSDAVKITIGPRGRNVVLDKGYGAPTITNDGVTIAKEISLPDKFENMGAEIVKEVASKTNDVAGDGTTTAVVLMQAIVSEGMRQITMGVNAMGVRLGIEHAAREVVEALRKMAKPIKTKSEIMQVATISAESAEIGTIIADTIEKVGKDGVVTVEESQSFGVESDVVKGLEFDNGYVSPYMVTNVERMEAEYKDAPILITDKKISTIKDILPLLEELAGSGRKELVIIADDVDGEALATFVVNKLRGAFNVLAVKAPGYGDRKKEMLEDIAVVTGGRVVSEDIGVKLENVKSNMLGHAGKVIATKENTTIVGGKGKKADISVRVEQLKKLREQSDSKFDKEKLDERIGKLSGGVAVIRVGAATETEMKYLKLKIEDAVAATKAAIEEGIVPGGGTALVKAGALIGARDMKSPTGNFKEEFPVGVAILLRALDMPLLQIAKNSGKGDGSIILEKVKFGKGAAIGYNALTDELVHDMVSAGIVDPVKVERSALENAASAAAIFLTTEVAITDEPEEKKDAGMGGMGGMGGGMPDMY